ncbi:MAG: hypothetical protein GY820_02545, partial [Gammaproteobacteria bacterium]|nr:hypothetical protein [Gammaproteobacteria bacterium]
GAASKPVGVIGGGGGKQMTATTPPPPLEPGKLTLTNSIKMLNLY